MAASGRSIGPTNICPPFCAAGRQRGDHHRGWAQPQGDLAAGGHSIKPRTRRRPRQEMVDADGNR
eukprot:5928293-Pleurochrysis_carterae.AAC.2